ncbi:ATP-dependent DNA helicase RecG [Tumebacillus avium]|uniref:ATP-dependent DNA helicase RecG n=1 Tax=Tumebacillus avium TaxID=1903704 RepID=A0A1Y0IP90_9BACL|nr:ATP-dependent DNA helicase RecG [Tumebacillus avium]ARU62392.1 ATP-dependent DNA helicase RecG [Tumebacillus avium]
MTLATAPVSVLPGVGPQRLRTLGLLGIFTLLDLITYYPFRYEDRNAQPGRELEHGARVTVRVTIDGAAGVKYRGKRASTTISPVVTEDYRRLHAVWFNQPYVKDQLKPGRKMTITGKYDANRRSITVTTHDFAVAGETVHSNRIVPVYNVKADITPKILRNLIAQAVKTYSAEIPELLPLVLRQKYRLIDRIEAVNEIHFPTNSDTLHQARRRLIFEEFFLFQLKLQAFRWIHRHEQPGVAHTAPDDAVSQFVQKLPFEMTGAQKRVAGEILRDMQSKMPMNRLVQGDVGSGKTILAFLAAYVAFLSGHQGAILVPTEILAEQHFRSAVELLEPLGVKSVLLVGSQKEKERREVLAEIESGEAHVIIGTHALLEEGVRFRSLSVVITDEQHRFGVEQRSIFRQKGHAPDVLFMSATPIPRTLAMSVFGDLDVSLVDELPAGRKPIQTFWITPDKEERSLRFIRSELAKGRQAYIVCPLVEESEKVEGVVNATDLYAMLKDWFAGFEVGLMHGKLRPAEKEEVMRSFVDNETQVLVSTTVIEVGVNVPNATVMMVYNAERFGLAQLHQLRGRVGRGEHASSCILMSKPDTEAGEERMKAMVATQNGFILAEKDLELRGPGEFFGVRQSGIPEFKIGDLLQDAKIMQVARDEVQTCIRTPDFWTLPNYSQLVDFLKQEKVLLQRAGD